MKYFNFKRYKIATILKNINFKRYNFSKIYKYLNLRKYNLSWFYNFFDLKRYSLVKIYKQIVKKKIKIVSIYILGFILLSSIVYLSIPLFYKYDKTYLSKIICGELKLQCVINGKASYNLFPSPRITIKDLIVNDLQNNKNILLKIGKTEIKFLPNQILSKEKINFSKLNLEDVLINLNYENLNLYIKHLSKNILSKKINLRKGKIELFDEKKFVTRIEDINFKYRPGNKNVSTLKGKFLGDDIYLNFKNNKDKTKDLVIKLKKLNFLTKLSILKPNNSQNKFEGNILIKKEKNRFVANYNFYDNQITILKSNLRNSFLDGKVEGIIKIMPFFDFRINLDLNSLNFNKLNNLIVELSEINQKNLFRINNKINGKLNMSAEKVFSKYTLINSFESQMQFVNGNILIDQMLLSLGKLGAADFTGTIKNDEKFTNLKFESNIFIDNLKRFYNKFGIYNKLQTSSNLFVSGNIDLTKFNLHIYEILNKEKIPEEDLVYIEREFNNIILYDGYQSFFNFLNIKEFVKLITSENN